MSYMRGAHYLWRDEHQIHLWAAAGYDGWDQSVWADGTGIDTEAVPERPMSAPSGVALPQGIADEYVLLRLAELVAAGDAVAVLDRALGQHARNGGRWRLWTSPRACGLRSQTLKLNRRPPNESLQLREARIIHRRCTAPTLRLCG